MPTKYFLVLILLVAAAIIACGAADESDGALRERATQSYNCDDIGEPCTGGSSGKPGTIRPCHHTVEKKCCCQTSAGLEDLGDGNAAAPNQLRGTDQ